MGMNLVSGCHKCKRVTFHYRNEENKTIMPFYNKHYHCMKENPRNVETKEDQIQEEPWMREYTEEIYKPLIEKLWQE